MIRESKSVPTLVAELRSILDDAKTINAVYELLGDKRESLWELLMAAEKQDAELRALKLAMRKLAG